jgi:putative Holliday junction resolvase
MRIMAVDYGKKRVGIALTDPLGIISQPLLTIRVRSQKALLRKIITIIDENSVGLVIIGNPLSHRGEATEMSSEIERFVKRLKEKKDIEIKLWDERFTSQYATNMLKTMNIKKKRGAVDQIAASIMLDEFLRSRSACAT